MNIEVGSLIFCYFAPPPLMPSRSHAARAEQSSHGRRLHVRGAAAGKSCTERTTCAGARMRPLCPCCPLPTCCHLLPPADLLLIIIAFFIPPHCAFRRRPLSHDFNLEEIPKEIINGSLSREVELRSRRRRDTFCRVLLKCQNVIYF